MLEVSSNTIPLNVAVVLPILVAIDVNTSGPLPFETFPPEPLPLLLLVLDVFVVNDRIDPVSIPSEFSPYARK